MKTHLLRFSALLILCLLSMQFFAQKNILFVGGGTEDEALKLEIMTLSYTVDLISEDDFKGATYASSAGYASYDALYISESVGSSSVVNYKTAGYPIPCVTTEGFAPRTDKWALLSDNETQHEQVSGTDKDEYGLKLIIKNNTHYVTRAFSLNEEISWSSNTAGVSNIGPTGFKISENIPEAVMLAINKNSVLGENFPTLWAIPDSAKVLSDTTVILPRIVLLGVVVPGLGEFATSDFNTIIKRSLQWVTKDGPAGIDSKEVNPYEVKVMPNPASQFVKISFELKESAEVELNIYDVTGRTVQNVTPKLYHPGTAEITLELPAQGNTLNFYDLKINQQRVTGKILIRE